MATVRLAHARDAGVVAAISRPFVERTAISFEAVPPDRGEMAARMANTTPRYPWLVCLIEGHIAGYAYASQHRTRSAYRWSVDTSVYVDAAHWRCGIGRGLYVSLLAILTAQGFFNAYAGITLPNPGSVALHEAVGFSAVGVYERVGYKAGAWHDVGWWQLRLRNDEVSPLDPLDMETISRPPGGSHW